MERVRRLAASRQFAEPAVSCRRCLCAEANPAVDFVYWRFGVAGLLGWKGACLLLLARFLPSIRGWTKSLLGASAFFCLAVAVYHCAGIAATL